MATEKLRLRVATPKSVKYDRSADMVILRCITGDWGILPKHEASSAILDYGVLRIFRDGQERRMAVFGGIAQVKDNVVTVLANDAEWPEDIDKAVVEAEHEQLKNRSYDSTNLIEMQKEQVKLRRTLVQIEVSAYPLISKVD